MALGKGNKGEALKDALEMMGAQGTGRITRMLGQFARMQRAGVVLDPTFIGKSVFRDIPFAMVNAGLNPMAFVHGATALFARSDVGGVLTTRKFHERMTEMVAQWELSGGSKSAFQSMDRRTIANTIRSMGQQGVGDKIVGSVVKNPLDFLAAISETMENATRVGHFHRRSRQLLAEAKKKGVMVDPQTLLDEAAIASREVSVDFQVHGASPIMANMRIITSFFNAALQGGDQMRRALVNDPLGVSSRMGMAITAPSVALYMINRKDPEYQQINRSERDLFWHIKRPGGEGWLRIPKPFEPGLLAGSMVEHFLHYVDTNDPELMDEAANDMIDTMLGGYVPIPTVMQPIMENLTNIDSYTGQAIVPMGLEDVDPRFHEASGFAKGWANFLNAGNPEDKVSPKEIDNLVRGWTGGLGAEMTQVADLAVESVRRYRGEPNPSEPVDRDLIEIMPVARAFVSPFPAGSQTLEEAANYASQMREASRTLQYLEESMKADDMVDYAMANVMKLGLAQPAQEMESKIAQFREQRAQIVSAPGMSGADKRRSIRVIDRAMLTYAQAVTDMFKDLGVRPEGGGVPMVRSLRRLVSRQDG